MISNRWIEQRKSSWSRLDALTRQVETSGIAALSGGELREFGLLYRQIAADLSAVRSDRASGTLEEYLNQLLSRAHNRIYSGRKSGLRSVVRFMAVRISAHLPTAVPLRRGLVPHLPRGSRTRNPRGLEPAAVRAANAPAEYSAVHRPARAVDAFPAKREAAGIVGRS